MRPGWRRSPRRSQPQRSTDTSPRVASVSPAGFTRCGIVSPEKVKKYPALQTLRQPAEEFVRNAVICCAGFENSLRMQQKRIRKCLARRGTWPIKLKFVRAPVASAWVDMRAALCARTSAAARAATGGAGIGRGHRTSTVTAPRGPARVPRGCREGVAWTSVRASDGQREVPQGLRMRPGRKISSA